MYTCDIGFDRTSSLIRRSLPFEVESIRGQCCSDLTDLACERYLWSCAPAGVIADGPLPGHNKGMNSLRTQSVADLLALHAAIGEALRGRGVLRSANNPTGDLAEYLFCMAFDWAQENNSARAFDATDADGTRYQIKGRRLHRRNKSRQLSAIRDLDGFETLAAVLFDDRFRVMRAALIPASEVRAHSTH